MEHRDRLARFGVGYLQAALAAQGRRVVVVADPGETTDDLFDAHLHVIDPRYPPIENQGDVLKQPIHR